MLTVGLQASLLANTQFYTTIIYKIWRSFNHTYSSFIILSVYIHSLFTILFFPKYFKQNFSHFLHLSFIPTTCNLYHKHLITKMSPSILNTNNCERPDSSSTWYMLVTFVFKDWNLVSESIRITLSVHVMWDCPAPD